jgi:hypothetical protein
LRRAYSNLLIFCSSDEVNVAHIFVGEVVEEHKVVVQDVLSVEQVAAIVAPIQYLQNNQLKMTKIVSEKSKYHNKYCF